jgi:hypothetical protein
MPLRHIHLQCSCHTPEHVVRVTLETWPGEHPELRIEPMLNPNRSLLRRIWVAIKYVFKADTTGGWGWDFDDAIVDDESMLQLTTLITHRNLVVKLQDMKRRRDKLALKEDTAVL